MEGFLEINHNKKFPPIYALNKEQFPEEYFEGQIDTVFNKEITKINKTHQTKNPKANERLPEHFPPPL